MNELDIKITELIELLDKDNRIKDITILKDRLINNKDIMKKIDRLRQLDIYSSEYKNLKKEIFNNKDFSDFKEKEAEIDYLILKINNKLNSLIDGKKCSNANN